MDEALGQAMADLALFFIPETAVGPFVGRVPSRGGGDGSCPVRRVRGPGLQPNRAYLDLTRRVSPWVPVHEPILPDEKGVYSFWHPH
ncbi:MAG: hypothetical protein RL153_999 [Verrucomicrobiota bacterium]